LQLSSSAGILETNSFPPGAHGDTITGIQGIGVKTPMAADVADATVGLPMHWHMPKGIIFIIGAKSIILAFGLFCIMGRIGTVTINMEGAIPKLHFSIAPIQTYLAIIFIINRCLNCEQSYPKLGTIIFLLMLINQFFNILHLKRLRK
jgi:hypothetical protein